MNFFPYPEKVVLAISGEHGNAFFKRMHVTNEDQKKMEHTITSQRPRPLPGRLRQGAHRGGGAGSEREPR